ncbi:unnamed protein product [Pleuronectes platessa]|uniref:Uncharacterized protein n=1 Tax=Pleuronectes platessa TaxID=8262 RepID=A0A9N7V9M2_PLEPL|nr:unnamed protein product [Pleuronectes platessa]
MNTGCQVSEGGPSRLKTPICFSRISSNNKMRTAVDSFKQLCGPAALRCYPGSPASSSYALFITCFQWPPSSRLQLEGQGRRAPAAAKVIVFSSAGGNWERTLGTSRLLCANRGLAG